MIDNDPNPHWFAPFELTLEDNLKDNDDWSKHFIKSFLSSNPIKVTLSDEGKKAYEYHFGIKPFTDINGRTEFANLEQLMEVHAFVYCDKYMLKDDEIFVKAVD